MQVELEVAIMSVRFLLYLVQYRAEPSNVLGILHHEFGKKKKKTLKYLTFICPCIAKIIQITTNKMQSFLIYLFLHTLYMFQAVPPPIIRSTQLYIQLQVLTTNTAACCYLG